MKAGCYARLKVCLQSQTALCFNCPEEDVQKLYPMYKPEYLSRAVRNWISYGIWDKEKFAAELAEFPER